MLCPTVHEPESPDPPRCSVDDPWYGSIRYRAYVRDIRWWQYVGRYERVCCPGGAGRDQIANVSYRREYFFRNCVLTIEIEVIIYDVNDYHLTRCRSQNIHITFWNQAFTILSYRAVLPRNIFWNNFGLAVSIHYLSFIISKFITTYLKLNLIFKFILFVDCRNTTKFIPKFSIYSFFIEMPLAFACHISLWQI